MERIAARVRKELEDSLRRAAHRRRRSVRGALARPRDADPFQGERFRQYLAAVDELKTLARARFGKSVLALAVRWVLDQGRTIALWGARRPDQLDPIDEIEGWHVDEAAKREIDAILKRCIRDPASPAFMAPPARRPAGISTT
jgi:aryl-alcohol dehydrogenase-like predicted oxidoreductase